MTETYISKVVVNLWKHELTLEWSGPDAAYQPKGPYACTPGRGKPNCNCDDIVTSRTADTDCTPKGTWDILGYQRRFEAYPEAEWVTQFQNLSRGIALHYYPRTPAWPASHGCIRIRDKSVAKLIYDRTEGRRSVVVVEGELRPVRTLLRRGDRGLDVEKLQRQLLNVGYNVAVDGDFGPGTEAALKAFQKQQMGPSAADGIFGEGTYMALFDRQFDRQKVLA